MVKFGRKFGRTVGKDKIGAKHKCYGINALYKKDRKKTCKWVGENVWFAVLFGSTKCPHLCNINRREQRSKD